MNVFRFLKVLIIGIFIQSCSNNDSCNQNCGKVIKTEIKTNLPINGDEVYNVYFLNTCNEVILISTNFDITYGFPGEINQPIQKIYVGEVYCN